MPGVRRHTPLPTSTRYFAWIDSLSFLLLTRTDAVVQLDHRVGVSITWAHTYRTHWFEYNTHCIKD